MQEMTDQPRLEPYEYSAFFEGTSARKPVVGTVARGTTTRYAPAASRHFQSGLASSQRGSLPEEVRERYSLEELLLIGKEQYEAYCIYCHDLTGFGNGIVPQRGFPYPPSFHTPIRRQQSIEAIFQVVSQGKGRMQPYAVQISPEHRWAIAAYVKALQYSQHRDLESLSNDDRILVPSDTGDRAGAATEPR
jgi:mono/diheme cytochrome c family protein